MKEQIYKLMDIFLIESKDQNGKERSIENLNKDRHLFVENMMMLVEGEQRKVIRAVTNAIAGYPTNEDIVLLNKLNK